MLFNSYTFVVFFAVVLALHFSIRTWRLRKLVLLAASYLFYAAWNPPFVVLLLISTAVDWVAARRVGPDNNRAVRTGFLTLSLVTNLGLLGFFKYGGFLLDNFGVLAALVGIHYRPVELGIVLPVGISFYTFQTLSYTLDVYRGSMKPWHSLLDFALYVTFFPQLVAGPIVRAATFLPQCESAHTSGRKLGWGFSLLVLGLFEKVVLADGFLAPMVDLVYDPAGQLVPDFVTAWSGTLAFAGQIFCDFAGYSTCAIGIAMCLGFDLPDNFRFPYAALGLSDFWRRWHISLSTWLRDYLYVPLGGNRRGPVRTYVNLMLTMLIGGLWHGAAWTFVAWGGLHGFYLVIERFLKQSSLAGLSIWNRAGGRFLIRLMTFAAVCFAWVFFRAVSFNQGFVIVGAMLGLASSEPTALLSHAQVVRVLVPVLLIVGGHHWLRDSTVEEVVDRVPQLMWAVALAGMILAIVMTNGADRAFIYYQF